jgi:O-antigen/teichoic acid export membrane protein
MTEAQRPAQPSAPSALFKTFAKYLASSANEENNLVQRLAGMVFLIRVMSAILAYGSQILLARWMGGFEFGIYVYAWTWVLLLGSSIDLGLASAAQRLIPEYVQLKSLESLRGFLSGSLWLSLGNATVVAAICAVAIKLLEPWLSHATIIPLYVACATLPAYALAQTQGGISRSYDWMGLALAPTFVIRQLFLTAILGAIYFAGMPVNAVTAMLVSGASVWVTALGTLFVLNRRLATRVQDGPRSYAFRAWLTIALPIVLVEIFFLLLTYVDILVLQQFATPEEVAVYYAAMKTLALVAFIHFAVSATTMHRFSQYYIGGDRKGLAGFLAQAIRWTFWPSVVATGLLLVFGRHLLNLFGEEFAGGYHLMLILSIGLLARAAVGPVERLLSIVGEWRACALVYCLAFALNFGLCIALIPFLGATGAAIASTTAMVGESILLFFATKIRLGFHGVISFGGASLLALAPRLRK